MSCLHYGYVILVLSFLASHLGFVGHVDRISMSVPDQRSIPTMEGLLPPIINLDSIIGFTGYLLARDPFLPHPDRSRTTTGHLLGHHR
jgi:hypothetical protein